MEWRNFIMDDMSNINIDFTCTSIEQYNKYRNELEKIKNDFMGMKCTTLNKHRLQQEILWLHEYINVNDPFENINVELTGPVAYNDTEWLLKDILQYHKYYDPENHNVQKEYSRIEVNNMLFDLKALGIINSYTKVAEPFPTSFNNQPYPKDKTIEVGLKYNRELSPRVEPYNFGKTLKDLTITIGQKEKEED